MTNVKGSAKERKLCRETFEIPDLGIRISFVIRISSFQSASLRFEHFYECFLRDVDFPDAFHPFFSFFLFLQ